MADDDASMAMKGDAAGDAAPDAHTLFVRLLLAHESRVRGFIRGLVPTWNDVDEVLQQASLVAWKKFADFEPHTDFGSWLMVISRFEALKHRRRASRGPRCFSPEAWELLASEADPAAHDGDRMARRRAALDECLAALAEHRRHVLLEAHTPGVRIGELARRLGHREQAFYKTIQRLRAALLTCMQRRLVGEAAT
jgi:RNA polymerase sigma-70 factor (ECF subfamily)